MLTTKVLLDFCNKYLSYSPTTGVLIWRESKETGSARKLADKKHDFHVNHGGQK